MRRKSPTRRATAYRHCEDIARPAAGAKPTHASEPKRSRSEWRTSPSHRHFRSLTSLARGAQLDVERDENFAYARHSHSTSESLGGRDSDAVPNSLVACRAARIRGAAGRVAA